MAGPIFIPNWLHVVLVQRDVAETVSFTFSYRNLSGSRPTGPQLLLMATELYSLVANRWKNCTTSNNVLVSCTVRDMHDSDGLEQVFAPVTPQPGLGATPTAPSSVCVTASEHTAFVGRSGRGRFYVSGMASGDVAGNVLTPTIQTNMLLLGTDVANYIGPAGFLVHSCVASRFKQVLYNLTAVTIANRIDSQDRRLPGHRRHRRAHVTPT
jgi:hypothetical protein